MFSLSLAIIDAYLENDKCNILIYFIGRERDAHEVKDYYAAFAQLEQYASQNHPVTEKVIQTF